MPWYWQRWGEVEGERVGEEEEGDENVEVEIVE
jgi:hypothetical protein